MFWDLMSFCLFNCRCVEGRSFLSSVGTYVLVDAAFHPRTTPLAVIIFHYALISFRFTRRKYLSVHDFTHQFIVVRISVWYKLLKPVLISLKNILHLTSA